ncbi:MAG: aminoacetone oxidase family FAD-binding enzyme [Anaerolineales bacterium]|nr:aminoacetone oxidase family FAD-binding enzyme [Anaerolineales bacterium]
MKNTNIIGIVGAGPAGIMAALMAAGSGARILLIDSNRLVGRKLLVTGNGRCNLTNANVSFDRYTCADDAFMKSVLGQFDHKNLLMTLEEYGILTYSTHDGWYYPLSDSAATVQEALAEALNQAGIELNLQIRISNIRRIKHGFLLETNNPHQNYRVDRLIVAAGGKAYPALGAKGDCFPILEHLGHSIVPVRPALAPIRADVKRFHKLQGVRLDVHLTLIQGEEKIGETTGNLLFTQFGFSGPAAMDLSHLVREDGGKGNQQRLIINLIPYYQNKLRRLIIQKRSSPYPLRVLLGAVLPVKIPPVYLELAGLDDVRLDQVSDSELENLMNMLTGTLVDVTGTRGFQYCQLSTGGVPVNEVDYATMASQRNPGLYLAGEVLDVVGPCGGYNLHFAFSSGAIAGLAAGKSVTDQ